MVKNYWDRIGVVRMQEIQVVRLARFLLRLESQAPTGLEPPEEAFSERSLDRIFYASLQLHLTEHYAGRDLHVLIPKFDLQRWLQQQRNKKPRLGWINDILDRQSHQDEADWWKRGEEPPY